MSPALSGSVSITAANQPPTITGFTIPATADSLTVPVITFSATDNIGVTGYLITEIATAPPAAFPGWSVSPAASFTTSGGPGVKTLYAWAKDAAGNVSDSKSAATTVTLLPQTLTVTVTGHGSVNSAPSGVGCT